MNGTLRGREANRAAPQSDTYMAKMLRKPMKVAMSARPLIVSMECAGRGFAVLHLRLLWPKRHSFYQFLCNPRSLHNTATSSRSATTAYNTEIGG